MFAIASYTGGDCFTMWIFTSKYDQTNTHRPTRKCLRTQSREHGVHGTWLRQRARCIRWQHTCATGSCNIVKVSCNIVKVVVQMVWCAFFVRFPTAVSLVTFFFPLLAFACIELGRFLFALKFSVWFVPFAAKRVKIIRVGSEKSVAAIGGLLPETISWRTHTLSPY